MVDTLDEETELKDERDEAIEVFISFDGWRSVKTRRSEVFEGEPSRVGE
jgi:hypothetical protein